MNKDILIGPLWDKSRLKRYQERNVLIYGDLKIFFMDEKKNIKCISLEEVK
jgi:hypothetical protein